ncbi:MAG: hydrogenase maturation protease [Vicinamibacterales bacterium]
MADRLVLGIGNLLMGDEGVGVHAIEYLRGAGLPDDVNLLDGGTGGFHLLDVLSADAPLVMIDATMDGEPAGTVRTLRPRYACDFPRALSAHDIGLRDLMEAAQITGALPDVALITVSIDEIRAMDMTLSPAVASALPAVREAVVEALARQRALTPAGPSSLVAAASASGAPHA